MIPHQHPPVTIIVRYTNVIVEPEPDIRLNVKTLSLYYHMHINSLFLRLHIISIIHHGRQPAPAEETRPLCWLFTDRGIYV